MRHLSDTALVAYVAAPHAGYLQFFRKYAGATLFIVDEEIIGHFQPLVRHLPGNRPADAKTMIEALGIFKAVWTIGWSGLRNLRRFSRIVLPDEDVSRTIAERLPAGVPVEFDGSWRLRWDWGQAAMDRDPEPDSLVSLDELDRALIWLAKGVAERSPDWWRQVGALLVRDGEILLTAHNEHAPHEQSAYLMGDPRSNFGPGEHIEVSGAIHAETALIATAAAGGIVTKGCDLYLTTFSCPPCAVAVAYAGIRRLYYATGYSLVAGADVLRSRGVKIIRVVP